MSKKTKTDEPKEETVLVAAAKKIGETAGKIAALAGATAEPKVSLKVKIPKLAKKNKSRLPRRQKKAQKKALAV